MTFAPIKIDFTVSVNYHIAQVFIAAFFFPFLSLFGCFVTFHLLLASGITGEHGLYCCFFPQIHNDDGVWLRLNDETIKKYVPNMNGYTEAWCLSFNQHLGKSLLVPVDVSKRWFQKACQVHSFLITGLSLIKAFQF